MPRLGVFVLSNYFAVLYVSVYSSASLSHGRSGANQSFHGSEGLQEFEHNGFGWRSTVLIWTGGHAIRVACGKGTHFLGMDARPGVLFKCGIGKCEQME